LESQLVVLLVVLLLELLLVVLLGFVQQVHRLLEVG
jgi:hypothetical protein